jgi:nitroreductase
MYKAPVYIVAYLDLRTQVLKKEYHGLEELFGVETVSAALQNIALASVSLGLGTCWVGVTSFIEKKLNEVLNSPDRCKLVALMPLGYPSEEVKSRPRKKTLKEVTKII